MKWLKLFENFVDIDGKKLYKKLSSDELLDLILRLQSGRLSSELPSNYEKQLLKQHKLGMGSIEGNGKRVMKLSDEYWLAMNNKYYYLCDGIDGVINCPITN